MGNSKSLYSKPDLLYYHIERKDIPNIRKIIETHPELVNDPITKDTKQTALIRAAFNNNLQITNLLLSFNADTNYVTPKGQTALSTAVKRCHIQIAKTLINAGANINHISPTGFRIIDFAILGGYYQLARFIFNKLEPKDRASLQDPPYYEKAGKEYSYRYVNYQQFLEGLALDKEPQEMPNFLKKVKPKLADPVCDPRETWKEWFKRQMDWRDAPLVERSSLPQNLQPQNRTFGKVHHYTNNLMSTHLSQKTKLYPPDNRECISEMADLHPKKSTEGNEKIIEAQSQL